MSQGGDLVTLDRYHLRPFGQFLPQPSPHFCIWLNLFLLLEQEKTIWQEPKVCVDGRPLLGWWAARRPGEVAALAPSCQCETCGHVTGGRQEVRPNAQAQRASWARRTAHVRGCSHLKGRAALTFPKANALAMAPSRGVGREPQPWPGLELGLGLLRKGAVLLPEGREDLGSQMSCRAWGPEPMAHPASGLGTTGEASHTLLSPAPHIPSSGA